ncbi:MAG: sugar phosphate isomerase/epimerase [Deltaproteobacteria bacterium]|nr:sugar phosphate isomerase/epimerase [Deltaproteobacteria bacterium]
MYIGAVVRALFCQLTATPAFSNGLKLIVGSFSKAAYTVIIGARAHNVVQAAALAESGFPFVEISVLSAEAFHRDLKGLRQLRDRYGIRFLAHGPEEGNAWDPEFLKHAMLPCLREIIDYLPELGIELLTIHFWLDPRFIEHRIIEQKMVLLRAIADYAAGRGVQLCVENLSETAADFASALSVIETLGMTLDIGHGELLAAENTAYDFLAHCAEKIYHMHAHDNRGGSSPADDLHLTPGRGRIDFKAILRVAARQGYDRTVTIENAPEQALRGRDYIQKVWDSIVRPERKAP